MPLSKGDKIGPYEIVALLGKGGMGEVYRAHDANLSRDVAIKVLPAALAQDADRLARFERVDGRPQTQRSIYPPERGSQQYGFGGAGPSLRLPTQSCPESREPM